MTQLQNNAKKSTNGYQREPNCRCVICGKPMYRRPGQLKKVRHVACMEHRAEAQKLSGITEKQLAALALGSVKGTNYRSGYKHTEESKRKIAESIRAYCATHPDEVMARGAKTRGEHHRNWKGGQTRLNVSIRQMNEHRQWMDAIRMRDGKCVQCGSIDNLEAHHIITLAELLVDHGIKNRDDARKCSALWDLTNGITLCRRCHYEVHRRRYED